MARLKDVPGIAPRTVNPMHGEHDVVDQTCGLQDGNWAVDHSYAVPGQSPDRIDGENSQKQNELGEHWDKNVNDDVYDVDGRIDRSGEYGTSLGER